MNGKVWRSQAGGWDGQAGLLLTTQHHWRRGVGEESHTTPPPLLDPPTHPPTHPPLKDWAKFSCGPSANQTFSLAPSVPISLDQKFSSAPLQTQHHWRGASRSAPCARATHGVVERRGWTAGTTHGGVGHLGLAHAETQRGEAGGGRPQTTPATTSTTPGTPTTGHRQRRNGIRRNQHSPGTPTTGLRERGNDTSRSTGRSSQQNAVTQRNMRREERVTVQDPVKKHPTACHTGGSPPPPP